MENSPNKESLLDRIFIPSLWLMSIIVAVMITITSMTFEKKREYKERTREENIQMLLSRLEQHRFFLDVTMGEADVDPSSEAVVEYGYKVIQNLEEFATLSPFQQVRDSARVMQAEYLAHFPMVADSVKRLDLKTGDIIVRHNNDFHSELFRKLSVGEKRYSHLGIIESISADSTVVHHAAANDFTGVGGVETRMLYSFIPDGDFDVAIYRLDIPESQREAIIELVYELEEMGVPFDPLFDITDSKKLYCAEMVAYVVNKVVGEDTITASGNFMGRRVYTIEDCYRIPLAREVYRREGTATQYN